MAAKKETVKPKVELSEDEFRRQQARLEDARLRTRLMDLRAGYLKTGVQNYGNQQMQKDQQTYRESRQQTKLASRAVKDVVVNTPKTTTSGKQVTGYGQSRGPIALGRGDVLSGRTPDGGTRSLLEGFRSFIAGGGLRSGGR